jgi:hypothetical protein
VDDIQLTTLSIVLSRTCRFGGHTREFYSVAEHSHRVCRYVSDRTEDSEIRLATLLHDAHEAYSGFGDVCRPAKGLSEVVPRIEAGLDQVIAARFGFSPEFFSHELVKQADQVLLATEARDLMREPWQPATLTWRADLPEPLLEEIVPQGIDDAAWQFESRARVLEMSVALMRGNKA